MPSREKPCWKTSYSNLLHTKNAQMGSLDDATRGAKIVHSCASNLVYSSVGLLLDLGVGLAGSLGS